MVDLYFIVLITWWTVSLTIIKLFIEDTNFIRRWFTKGSSTVLLLASSAGNSVSCQLCGLISPSINWLSRIIGMGDLCLPGIIWQSGVWRRRKQGKTSNLSSSLFPNPLQSPFIVQFTSTPQFPDIQGNHSWKDTELPAEEASLLNNNKEKLISRYIIDYLY